MLRNPYDENDRIKVSITESDDETEEYFEKGRNKKTNIGLKFVSDNAQNGSFYSLIKKQRYWMAYMDMNPKLRIVLQFIVLLINFSIIALQFNIGIFINFIGSTTIPLMIYVFPGYLYYKFYQKYLTEDN